MHTDRGSSLNPGGRRIISGVGKINQERRDPPVTAKNPSTNIGVVIRRSGSLVKLQGIWFQSPEIEIKISRNVYETVRAVDTARSRKITRFLSMKKAISRIKSLE